VRTREAFGGTLWQKETIRQRLAMLATKVEAGRQLVYHAAWLDTQGVNATKEVSMVKAYCGELVNEVAYACVQFHGGMGFMRESTIERMARDARAQNIGGGATRFLHHRANLSRLRSQIALAADRRQLQLNQADHDAVGSLVQSTEPTHPPLLFALRFPAREY
jgi:alkylation response protein AidB-like acyl-CoA dehydrogenase